MTRARLKILFKEKIIALMMEEFKYKNVMEVPFLEKITINMGLGKIANDKKMVEYATVQLKKISGQKPVVTKARKSIAGFKIREGFPVGCMVTLRGERMYEFFDRLISIVLPRVRDFRGLSAKSFDKHGNYTFGIKEHIIFPEIEFDKADLSLGMDVILTIRNNNKFKYNYDLASQSKFLLKSFEFPIK